MQVYRYGEDRFERHPEASLTLGTFDGVHLGHRKLIAKVLEGECPTVVTFDPHPQHVLHTHPDRLQILTPIREKLRKLELLGVERTIVVPFSKGVASISAEEFLKGLLIDTIGMSRLVVGFNHSFGRNREGNLDFMQRMAPVYGYELVVVDAYVTDSTTVSSTGIRRALTEGRLDDANAYLGHAYRMEASVIRGDGRGRDLGYPTANLVPLDPDQLIPAEGVYAVRVYMGGTVYDGVGSIGRKETFGENPLAVEVHLFDTDLNLYDKTIQVEWIKYLRGQEVYTSPEELVRQMDRDSQQARDLLATLPKPDKTSERH